MRWWGQLLDNLTFLYANLRKIYVAPPPSPDTTCLNSQARNRPLFPTGRWVGEAKGDKENTFGLAYLPTLNIELKSTNIRLVTFGKW